VCAKRLEKSTFSWPQQGDMRRPVELVQLQALLEGYELTAKRIWFNRIDLHMTLIVNMLTRF